MSETKISFIAGLGTLCVVAIFAVGALFAGCRTTPAIGDESLVESRIITAVNAERNRWAAELSQRIGDGLRQVDKRVDAVAGGLQQVAVAAREYRQFVLGLIDSLLSSGSEESGIETDTFDIHRCRDLFLDPEDCENCKDQR